MPAGLFIWLLPGLPVVGLAVRVPVQRASMSVPLSVCPDLAVRVPVQHASLSVCLPVCRACLVGLSAQLVLHQLRCSPCRSTHAAAIHGNGTAVPISAS